MMERRLVVLRTNDGCCVREMKTRKLEALIFIDIYAMTEKDQKQKKDLKHAYFKEKRFIYRDARGFLQGDSSVCSWLAFIVSMEELG